MTLFTQMRLMTKIVSMGVVVIIVSATLAGVGVYNLIRIGDSIQGIAKSDIPLLNSITKITFIQLQQSVQLERALMSGEMDSWEEFDKANSSFLDLESDALTQFFVSNDLAATAIKAAGSSQQKRNYRELQEELKNVELEYIDFVNGAKELLTLVLNGNISGADVKLPIVKKQVEDISVKLQDLNAVIGGSTKGAAVIANLQEEDAELTMILISALSILVVIFIGIGILRSVNNQLGGDPSVIEEISESLANGDLKMNRNKNSVGVYGSINATVDRLIEIIGGIKTGANEVHDASELVSMGNENLSQRTQMQASSLEEVASSMEQMTGVINQTAENANLTNQLTIDAKEQAEKGVAVVNDAMLAVNEINESSAKIAQIIGVIDDIAFQTNLLALNAAVEAARAGEQGRGFAVVATEVRNLAGRSATAAKEIKELIQDSVEKVKKGAELVDASGQSLQDIVTSVQKASVMVTEIAEASKEQSEGIRGVNKALAEMDDMTQQNATLVEQAAAASLFMGEQANNLIDLVSYFNLDQQDGVANVAEINSQETDSENQAALPDHSLEDSRIEEQSVQDLPLQAASDWKDF